MRRGLQRGWTATLSGLTRAAVPPTTKVEAKVPLKAKKMVGPMFSKKALAFMLKPASKMIGGISQTKKNLASKRCEGGVW